MLQLPQHSLCMRLLGREDQNKVQYLKIVLVKRPVKMGLFLCSNFDEKKEVYLKVELIGKQKTYNMLYVGA